MKEVYARRRWFSVNKRHLPIKETKKHGYISTPTNRCTPQSCQACLIPLSSLTLSAPTTLWISQRSSETTHSLTESQMLQIHYPTIISFLRALKLISSGAKTSMFACMAAPAQVGPAIRWKANVLRQGLFDFISRVFTYSERLEQ